MAKLLQQLHDVVINDLYVDGRTAHFRAKVKASHKQYRFALRELRLNSKIEQITGDHDELRIRREEIKSRGRIAGVSYHLDFDTDDQTSFTIACRMLDTDLPLFD